MTIDQEFQEYAQSLPQIYREILESFPRIEPTRKKGFALGFQTLASDFESRKLPYQLGEVIEASSQLEQHGLVTIKNRVFLYPTESGERLIQALTGHEPLRSKVPPLPPPPSLVSHV